MTKLLVILAVLLSIIYFSLAGSLFTYRLYYKTEYQKSAKKYDETVDQGIAEITKWKGDIDSKMIHNSLLRSDIASINISIKERKDQYDVVQKLITDLAKRIEELTANNGKLKDEHKKLTTSNDEIQTQVTAFRDRQKQLEKERNDRQDEMQKVSDELAKDKRNLASLNDGYLELSKKLRFVEQSLEYYKKLLTEPIGPAKIIKGKVLAVSETHKIVIINVGTAIEKEISVGNEFTVYRGDKYISKIRVDKVEKEYSSAVIMPGTEKESIKVGDDITTSPY
ncbi:MAG: hypothetical protein HY811_07720 [Planctomycetes bacterium]|nr:hypothetical protein [Planctomycetota bacterium]